jgi:hypothetical protein
MSYPGCMASDEKHSRNRRLTLFLVTAPPTRLLTTSPTRVISLSDGTDPNIIRPSLMRRPRSRTLRKSAPLRSLAAVRIEKTGPQSRAVLMGSLNGQACAAASAPTAQHPAAADGTHAQPEPVNTEAASLLRLICAFWHLLVMDSRDSKKVTRRLYPLYPSGHRRDTNFEPVFLTVSQRVPRIGCLGSRQ